MNIGKELNKKLCEAAIAETVDFNKVEELLSLGADPLGLLTDYDDSCVLEELFCEASEYEVRKNLYSLVELFIKRGMRPEAIPSNDNDDEHLILWSMSFCCSDEALRTLELLLDNNLNPRALEDFINHFYMDAEMVDGAELDEMYTYHLTSGLKMVMLSSSYPTVLAGSEYLRSCIEMDDTNKDRHYDLGKFRNYDGYEYIIDTSTCDNLPHGLRNATVSIVEKESNEIVWMLHI